MARKRNPITWRKVPMARGQGQLWQNASRHGSFRHRMGAGGPLRTFMATSVPAAREHVVAMGWCRPADPEVGGLTLGAMLDQWMGWRRADPDARTSTLTAHGHRLSTLHRLCPDLMATPLARVTPDDLEDAYRAMRGQLAQRSVASVHATLSAAYTWAERRWRTDHVPRRTVAPRVTEAPVVQGIPPADFERILFAARERAGTPISLFVELLTTGLRCGEALGVRWDDIDWEGRRIRIDQQRTRTRTSAPVKTKRSRRVVDVGLTSLSALAAARPQGDTVVTVGHARIQASWRALVDPIGPYTIHQMRHAVASRLLAAGIPLVSVAAQLGDSPEMVLRVYAHAMPTTDGLRTALDV